MRDLITNFLEIIMEAFEKHFTNPKKSPHLCYFLETFIFRFFSLLVSQKIPCLCFVNLVIFTKTHPAHSDSTVLKVSREWVREGHKRCRNSKFQVAVGFSMVHNSMSIQRREKKRNPQPRTNDKSDKIQNMNHIQERDVFLHWPFGLNRWLERRELRQKGGW